MIYDTQAWTNKSKHEKAPGRTYFGMNTAEGCVYICTTGMP